jgi:hypothetical protein
VRPGRAGFSLATRQPRFEADLTGRFEIENDETEEELGELQVRPVNQTLGLLLLAALSLGAYLGFVGLSRVLGGGAGASGGSRRTRSRSCR